MRKMIRNQAHQPLKSSLQFKTGVMFLVVLCIIMLSTVYIMRHHVRQSLIEINIDLIEETGYRIATELGQRVSTTEALANSLVKIVQISPNDPLIYNKFIPALLSLQTKENIIEGGGIWPAPYLFDQHKERSAFFWGKSDGDLKYFDNYNDPYTALYHNADWYIPAAMIKNVDKCFWSAAYTNPHTNVPLLTCARRIIKDGGLFGIATVDLNLSGLDEFFKEVSAKTNSYTLAFNTDGSVISFPFYEALRKRNAKTSKSEQGAAFNNFADLRYIVNRLEAYRLQRTSIVRNDKKLKSLKDNIILLSDHISPKLAETTVAIHRTKYSSNENIVIDQYNLEHVPFFDGTALVSVFEVPETLWKIVIISPQSATLTIADKTTRDALIYLIIMLIFAAVLWFIFANRTLIKPLKAILNQLEQSPNEFEPITHHEKDEYSLLVEAFNTRNQAILESKLALEKANDELSSFAYRTSHDLRSPIASMQGILDMAKNFINKGKTDKALDMLERADGVIANQFKLINDILALCKTDHEGTELTDINMNKFCQKIIDQLEHMEHFDQITFKLNIAPDLVISTQKVRLEQVLENLISNAIKYSDQSKDSPFVTITADTNEETITIDIEDNALTIPETSRDDMFKMFKRFHPRSSFGSGLGLYIVQKHIEHLHGTISCIHNNDGKIFRIILSKQQ